MSRHAPGNEGEAAAYTRGSLVSPSSDSELDLKMNEKSLNILHMNRIWSDMYFKKPILIIM